MRRVDVAAGVTVGALAVCLVLAGDLAATGGLATLSTAGGAPGAAGESMNYDRQHIVLTSGLVEPSVGDEVRFRTLDGAHVQHRLVRETAAGWLTQGDAYDQVDQAPGFGFYAPVPDERITDVVVFTTPVPHAAVGLVSMWGAGMLGGLALRLRGRSA